MTNPQIMPSIVSPDEVIAEQRLDALADDLTEVHGDRVLRHSMGLSLAARRAG